MNKNANSADVIRLNRAPAKAQKKGTFYWKVFTSNSFAAVTFRIRGNLWHKNMLSWIIHFCTVVGFSQGSRLQNTSTEVTSLLGSPHFVISFLTNLKISNENSSVGRIGWSQPALSNFSNAFNSGSVILSFFLWS